MKIFLAGWAVLVLALMLLGCQKEALPEQPVPLQAAVVAPPLEPVSLMYEIRVLGKQGFDHPELNLLAGDGVVWINQDPQGKAMEMVLQKGTSRKFITSPVFKLGERYQYAFTEPATYTYWTVGYGVKGTVVVR